jgi:hypothetical protein
MPSSQMRRTIGDVPHQLGAIKSRVTYLRTPGGVNFEMKVIENTTNAQAIDTIEKRIAAATQARREGKPHGIYTGPSRADLPQKTYIQLDMRVGNEKYNIRIDIEGNAYKIGQGPSATYEVSLRQAVAVAAQKADARLAMINSQAAAQQNRTDQGYRPGMRM